MSNRISCIGTFLLAAPAAFTQLHPAPKSFEVASIRPNTLNDRIVTIDVGPGGRFTARGYTLVLLIQMAYGVMDWNVTGGPGWIRSDRFDVTASASVIGNLTERQLQPMLQALLADRFKLRLHNTSREMAGYALEIAKGSPKLKASAAIEEQTDSFRLNSEGLRGEGIAMETFARFVGGKLGLVALDQTGLKGLYDFKVTWKVETDPSPGGSGFDSRDALRFAVSAAIQDQLGLRLTAKKIPVQQLEIDYAEKASASEN